MVTRATDAITPIREYFSTEDPIYSLDWRKHFSVETLNDDYIPQGIVHDQKTLYHSIHKRDRKSVLIIFDTATKTYSAIKELMLPREATHTSDLTIYQDDVYAIDYTSNYVYQFSLKDLRRRHKAKLKLKRKAKVYLGYQKFGSLEIVVHEGRELLLLTSFAIDNRLFVLDFRKFFDEQVGFEAALLFSVEASYFTQGLYYQAKSDRLYHSVNRFGVDFIYELDLSVLLTKKQYRPSIRRVYLAPNGMVEDLSVQEDVIHTSDEQTFGVYSATFDSSKEMVDYQFNDVTGVAYYEKLLSHRARVKDFQENTLDAYREVLGTNIKYIEIDIRYSSDGVPFAYHDAHFTGGKKQFRFSDRTWKEIEQYRYYHKDLMVTKLEAIIDHFVSHRKPGQILALDVKDFGFEKQLYDLLAEKGILGAVMLFTWTPQTILAFDEIFQNEGKSFPIYFSHVRTDSMFKYLLVPWFLNYRRFFLSFRDFVLIGEKNYKTPLGKFAHGYRHVPYFGTMPQELVAILKKYDGGVCITKKAGKWGDCHLKKLKEQGLKVAVFGAFFGLVEIDSLPDFVYEAQKEYVDLVFMDDLANIFGKS